MKMDWYYYIALAAILPQILFLIQAYNNSRYALSKYKKKRSWYRPRTALIVPCKGLDSTFEKNIASFFNQDYENYLLFFVVADESDPAYSELCKLKNQLSKGSNAQDVQVLVSNQGQSESDFSDVPTEKQESSRTASRSCSEKIQNLLYCYERIGDDVEVLAFADSDICVCSDWLSHIVYPLRKSKNGAASGYRWFIPKRNNSASLALSAMNAKVAQLLGNTPFNQAWGGSMAIRVDVFREVGLDKIWPRALSDDLSLSYAVKKAGKRVSFVPACLTASYESMSWGELFEFGRRQFLITRVSTPKTWWFGLFSSLYSVLGLWGTVVLALWANFSGKDVPLLTGIAILFFLSQMSGAILRQRMISKLFKKDLPKMQAAMAADILLFWIWSALLLVIIISSAFGRTIEWRGKHYKLFGLTETLVVSRNQ
jgi:cellulose synthase/poly-beta-1,6-N-acetylglucosamine synthase-like glycosyltransferase